MNNNKKLNFSNKKIILIIVLSIVLIVGGTYAAVKRAINITNGMYGYSTSCFDITYDQGEDITGTLLPSSSPTGGLNGYVSIGFDENCSKQGMGNLYLNVSENDNSTAILTQKVEPHCENLNTLKTLKDYTDKSSCNAQPNGIWVTDASALKYAVYVDEEEQPVSVGYINELNKKINIYNNFDVDKSVKYTIFIWLDGNISDNSYLNATFSGNISATVEQTTNAIIKPILDKGMIPVTISDTGVVTTIGENDKDWFDYKKQKWANAVLVSEETRNAYLNIKNKVVSEEDILGYYVWIPRYKYKIWTTGTSTSGSQQTIDIVFESVNEPITLGTAVDEYRTHPAFWWDNNSNGIQDNGEMVSGIWVGKFETTGEATMPTVKPNTASLTSQTVSAQFNTSLLFAGGSMNSSTGEVTFDGSNTYGLTDAIDSHMMKNSEWGAVAYLSHSQYGINEEVRINNYFVSSKTLTGCGAASANAATATTCAIPYGTPSSETHTYPQSTTGNITGVFDMSGGTWDYVMGNYNKTTGSSGFSIYPVSKYYDLYTTTSMTTACNNGICYGHSLSETNNWYGDINSFITSTSPWLLRGADYGETSKTGVFGFSITKGTADVSYGFRSVLIPKMSYTVNFDPTEGELIDISYTTAEEHEFTVPITDEYKIEVWGAGGGMDASQISYGGYSVGNINLEKDENLYVNVGGTGTGCVTGTGGGYNGGGNAGGTGCSGSGGGATHIATESGLLKDLSQYAGNHNSPILIVAGGGGGNSTNSSGGGIVGGNSGGTQTTGYAFGQGGTSSGDVSGGGGGYYGGNAGSSAGGGGSGYIANISLTNKMMYCYNCTTSSEESTLTYSTTNVSTEPIAKYAKSGDGAARISQLSSKNIVYNKAYGNLPTPTRDGYAFLGWYTEDGTKITDSTIVNTKGNITLYAKWEPVSVSISYSVNGGIIQSTTSDSIAYNMRTANNNTTYNLRPINSTTYNWSTTNDIIYLNNQALNTKISMLETKSLLSYNDVNYMNITKDGYGVPDDKEWLCLSGCKSNNLRFSQNVEYTFTDFCDNLHTGCNVVLGVNFAKKFAVSFNGNGGNGGPDSQVKLDGNTLILSSSTPTRTGYTFLGWSDDPDATSPIYTTGSEFTINDNVTLYAIWEKGKYTESILNGTDPELESGMIPVTISDTGAVTVADTSSEWYNYGNKQWANAVLVNSTSRSTYINPDGTFNANTPIPEADILAYYVWIPRYKYTFPKADGNPETISIFFENNETDKSIPASGKASGTDYYTHPAFTFGTKELNGIWVGKFETTGTATEPTIKPNEIPLTGNDAGVEDWSLSSNIESNYTVLLNKIKNKNIVSQLDADSSINYLRDLFDTSLKFSGGIRSDSTVSFTGNNTYGLTDLTDSHMMKNSEWGAVAYLSHSIYGKNAVITCNNNGGFITGSGNDTLYGNPTIGNYTYPQSTTGNITGVFDMSGGTKEYVMGNYNDTIYGDLFFILPDAKYYNKYTVTSMDNCTLFECGGHALYETTGWYDAKTNIVNEDYPWFMRGDYPGAFDSDIGDGFATTNIYGFRAVLVKGA